MQGPSRASLVLGLGGAVAAISSAALVILLAAPLPALVIAMGRVAVTAVALLGASLRAVPGAWRALRAHGLRGHVVLAAALLAVHFGAWVASLTMTTVPRSVTLVATQPLFAGLLGRLVGDRAPWSLYLGAAVAVVGTMVMVGGFDAAGPGGFNLGDGLALGAGAAAAAYLVVGRSVGQRVPLRVYLGLVHLGAAALLGITVLVAQADPIPADATLQDGLALIYLGLVPGVMGHGLLNWAVRHVPVHVVALAILFEPIGATVLTVLVLGHAVGTAEVIGALVLLLGVAVGRGRAPRR